MKFKRTEEEDFSLQLTPLVDVVFLLLIFFMVSTAFIDFTRQMDIELPEVKAGEGANKEKVYEIEITKNKLMFINGQAISLEKLAVILEENDPTIKKRSVVIRADRKLEYGLVVKVMGICRESNIHDISVAVQ